MPKKLEEKIKPAQVLTNLVKKNTSVKKCLLWHFCKLDGYIEKTQAEVEVHPTPTKS